MHEQAQPTEIEAMSTESAQETPAPPTDARVDDLERRIRELEAAIGDLRTVSASAGVSAGRKTQASYAPRLMAKGAEPARSGEVEAALGSLSVEQRFAVKAGLLRAGLL